MIDSLLIALTALFSWPTVAFLVVGTMIGLVFGAIPGLGGVIAIALVIPFTFGMDTQHAIVLFGSILGGVAFGGSISAILLNVPGTAPNVATLLDGYPMTQNGRGGEALAISATSSALGAIFGIGVLVALIPVSREILLAFSSPEFFWLAVLGLSAIAATSRSFILKGIAVGGVGFMLSLIGYSPVTGELRYTYGSFFLWDGIGLIPALIGMYAIGEAIRLSAEGGTLTRAGGTIEGSILGGVKYVVTNPIKLLRASMTGVLIGIVPGVGGVTANFIAYMQAAQTSDDPDSFGKGNPDGVLASEAANDAKDGGALLPTVVFGIPGSAVMAVILGGLILHGLTPGRSLLNANLDLLFLLLLALLFSNILTSVTGLGMAKQLTKITRIDVSLIVPAILVISLVGTFALRANLGDVVVAAVFGFVGYGMAMHGYPRVALVLGLILGELAEVSFLQTLQISDTGYLIFVTRPISTVLIVLILLSLLWPFRRSLRDATAFESLRRKLSPSSVTGSGGSSRADPSTLTRAIRTLEIDDLFRCSERYYDVLLALTFTLFVGTLLVVTPQYRPDSRLFPWIVGVPTLVSLLLLLGLHAVSHPALQRSRSVGREPEVVAVVDEAPTRNDQYTFRRKSLHVSVTVVAALVLIFAVGMLAGIVVYAFALFYFETKALKKTAVYGAALSLFVYVVFVLVLGVRMTEGALFAAF